jgi:hypothetical protein
MITYLLIFAAGAVVGALLARVYYLRELNEMDEIATEAVALTKRAIATTRAAYGQHPKQRRARR